MGIGGGVYLPVVPLLIERSGRQLKTTGIVDTGADLTVMPAELLEALGTSWEELASNAGTSMTAQGVSGKFDLLDSGARIRSFGREVTRHAMVAAPGGLHVIVLGRGDFLRQFKVTLDWTKTHPRFELVAASVAKTIVASGGSSRPRKR
jgi:hypothetical protein